MVIGRQTFGLGSWSRRKFMKMGAASAVAGVSHLAAAQEPPNGQTVPSKEENLQLASLNTNELLPLEQAETVLRSSLPDKIVQAINSVPLWGQVGQQPYEMTWVQREPSPHTLEDFEDLAGWKLELWDGATGALYRSREQQMWGEFVAKFEFSSPTVKGRVIARPDKPIPIPGKFDCVEMWGFGNHWSYMKDPSTPPAEISVLITDTHGKETAVELTTILWKQWWLIHRRIPADVLKNIALPATVSGIEISKIGNMEPRYFFCDTLAVFSEELKPLQFTPQPKRNLAPVKEQIQGVNTGEGTLPFPTREETILPLNYSHDYRTSVRQVSTGNFRFSYKGRDASVVYEYHPATGSLSEITASVDGDAPFHPLNGGGVQFKDIPDGTVFKGTLQSATLKDDVVTARFREGSHSVEYRLRLWQKSLVLDVSCPEGEAEKLSFGEVRGVTSPKLITVPYITYQHTNPRVLMHGSASKPLFTSVWFDWYRGNGSKPYYTKTPQIFSDGAQINGGIEYIPKTDGRRNPMYERLFLTSSPVYEEVLPTIANPPALHQKENASVVWTVAMGFNKFQTDHTRCRKIRALGLDHIMQHSHEITWRDAGESNTLRLKPAPQKGSTAGLQWYIREQNALGWTQGVYTNYSDFCSTNENWNPDWVLRESDGEWQRVWTRDYALKPVKAVEFDEYYAKRIKDIFGVKMSYTDVHTATGPWDRTDFDSRVPGAGTMSATFYAYGQLLLNDQRVYGPAPSEGTYQWLYAGLDSGDYGSIYTDLNLLTHPLDVAFHLVHISPLHSDYGTGDMSYYVEQIDPHWTSSPKRRDYLDLFLATTIAYGNMGNLVDEFSDQPFRDEALARSYYMMQQAQQQYAYLRPSRIEYEDGRGNYLSPSQAHSTGIISMSRLHVVYPNGTEAFVNRSSSGSWTVRDNQGKNIEIPVSGWLIFNTTNRFYEISANRMGRRIDYVSSLEFEFLDGRGQWTQEGNIAASGSVALRHKDSDKTLELTDIYGNKKLAVRSARRLTVTAYDSDGKSMGNVKVVTSGTWHEIQTLPGARTYRCT